MVRRGPTRLPGGGHPQAEERKGNSGERHWCVQMQEHRGASPCAVTTWVCVRLPSQPEQPGAQGRAGSRKRQRD